LETLSSVGYNFQIETTYRAYRLGATIQELPITFTERTVGQSKFSPGILIESFWRVLELRFKK
jgi:dolichol-phosphate mannosyltransferase